MRIQRLNTYAGAHEEFIFVGRLDNLAMSYCSIRALIDAFPDEASLSGQSDVKAVVLFDHEEVGSTSAQGGSHDASHMVFMAYYLICAFEIHSCSAVSPSKDAAPSRRDPKFGKQFQVFFSKIKVIWVLQALSPGEAVNT